MFAGSQVVKFHSTPYLVHCLQGSRGNGLGLVEFSNPNFHNWGMVASILKALNSSKLHTVPANMVRHELVPKR